MARKKNKPLTIPIERFMSVMRFEHKGKLVDLGINSDYLFPRG